MNNLDVRGGRIAVLWKISDEVSFKPSGLVQDDESGSSSFVDTTGRLQLTSGLTHNELPKTGPFELRSQLYTGRLTADFGRRP